MSRSDVYQTLRAAGIKWHSHSYQDYEKAKKMLLSETLSQYEWGIRHHAIVEYLGI